MYSIIAIRPSKKQKSFSYQQFVDRLREAVSFDSLFEGSALPIFTGEGYRRTGLMTLVLNNFVNLCGDSMSYDWFDSATLRAEAMSFPVYKYMNPSTPFVSNSTYERSV